MSEKAEIPTQAIATDRDRAAIAARINWESDGYTDGPYPLRSMFIGALYAAEEILLNPHKYGLKRDDAPVQPKIPKKQQRIFRIWDCDNAGDFEKMKKMMGDGWVIVGQTRLEPYAIDYILEKEE